MCLFDSPILYVPFNWLFHYQERGLSLFIHAQKSNRNEAIPFVAGKSICHTLDWTVFSGKDDKDKSDIVIKHML